MDEKRQAIVAELRDYFEQLYGPRLVRLVRFGSQARGDAEPGSDIDVLVVLEGPMKSDYDTGTETAGADADDQINHAREFLDVAEQLIGPLAPTA